jgi:caffeoyl-CoA O-methyltransferase
MADGKIELGGGEKFFHNVHPDAKTPWEGDKPMYQNIAHKSLLRDDNLYEYILETSVYPREHKALQGLRLATEKHAWSILATSADEGQFLSLLMRLINAKNTIEIGVFTGYSLLSTALALPEDGKVIALDISRESYDIGAPFFEEAGVAHKIDFRQGPALDTLQTFVKEEKNHGFFDFIFVDADKDNYMNYHPLLLKLVRLGGVIGYDNTLWAGSVANEDEESMPDVVRFYKKYIIELNKFLASDSRLEISQLSIGDGITLCRRIV